MSDWAVVWLGVMAIALVVTAVMQFASSFAVIKLAKQATQTIKDVQREIQPLIEKAHRIADDAQRTTAIAALQAERLDELVRTTTERVSDTLGLVQGAIVEPLRKGSMVMAIARAAFAIFNNRNDRRRQAREDEDALFVG